MNISTAGPTIVTSKAKDALAFYATHFGLTANDYGAGRRPPTDRHRSPVASTAARARFATRVRRAGRS